MLLMCKYKISSFLKYLVCSLFCLIIAHSCSEVSSSKLIDDPKNNIYVLEVEQEAGQLPKNKEGILAPPFNLVRIHSCILTDSTNNFSEGLLFSASYEAESLHEGRLVCGLRLKKRKADSYKIIPIFIPVTNSSFKYLPQEQFRLKYDEMLRISQNWIWNYYGYDQWTFDNWVSITFIHSGLESCLDSKQD